MSHWRGGKEEEEPIVQLATWARAEVEGIGSVKCDGKFWLRNRICPLSQAVTDGPHVSCFWGLLVTAGLNKFSERIWGLGGKMK